MLPKISRRELKEIRPVGCDDEMLPFQDIGAEAVNRVLRQYVSGDIRFTTYSLRKYFIGQIARKCSFDWEKVREHTLHKCDGILQSHYLPMDARLALDTE